LGRAWIFFSTGGTNLNTRGEKPEVRRKKFAVAAGNRLMIAGGWRLEERFQAQ
jgi:hypothetical protein